MAANFPQLLAALRTLWRQLSTPRAEYAAHALAVHDVRGHIRHVVRSVEREVAGAREADRLPARS